MCLKDGKSTSKCSTWMKVELTSLLFLMANCLKYAGYTFRFEYGMGSHNLSHAGSLFADTLNWMFNDNSPVGSASGSGMSKL